jgi:hypothetical protein
MKTRFITTRTMTGVRRAKQLAAIVSVIFFFSIFQEAVNAFVPPSSVTAFICIKGLIHKPAPHVN